MDDDTTSQPIPPIDPQNNGIPPERPLGSALQTPAPAPQAPAPRPAYNGITPAPAPQAPGPMSQIDHTPPPQAPLPAQPGPAPAPVFDGITPAHARLAGEPLGRTMAPGGSEYIPPPFDDKGGKGPGRSKKKLIIIIIAIVALVAVIGALVFYFAYWINPNVVFSRFQTTTASIITKSLTSGISMVDNTKYSAEVNAEYDGKKLSVSSNGQATKGSSEASSKITYNDTPLELQMRQPLPASGKEADFYFKYQGLSKFLSVAFGGGDDFWSDNANIAKYDDKWIMLNLADLLGGAQNETQKPEDSSPFTADETTQLSKAFAPIISSRIAGTDKNNAVYSYDKPTSEVVHGRQTYAYKMKFKPEAFKGMLDELIKTVDTANLTDKKKTTAKDIINGLKDGLDRPGPTCDRLAKARPISNPRYCTDISFTIWLEKNTSLPVQIEVISESKSSLKDGAELKTTDKTILKASMTSFSGESLKGQLNFTSLNATDNFNEYELLINFEINPKTGKLVSDEIQLKINTNKGKDTQTINGKLTVEPSGDAKPVEIPTPSVSFATFLGDIYQTEPGPKVSDYNALRQADARAVLSAALQFSANNNGKYPTADASGRVAIEDITGQLTAPDGAMYTWAYAQVPVPDYNTIYYTINTNTCKNSTPGGTSTNTKEIVVIVAREVGGVKSNWCVGDTIGSSASSVSSSDTNNVGDLIRNLFL